VDQFSFVIIVVHVRVLLLDAESVFFYQLE
jgi:hypothetical protein